LNVVVSVVSCGIAAWWPGTSLGAGDTAAVLPVRVSPGAAVDGRLVTTLGWALTEQLSMVAPYRVLGAEDVEALLAQEAQRQAAGCRDDQCLAEVADALGARWVVSGDVTVLGGVLLWTATVVERSSTTVVARASRRGPSMEALVAQAPEMALELAGRPGGGSLEGTVAQQRFGFPSPAGLRAFSAYREAHPAWTTAEALTRFLVVRNRESRGLALAQALLYGGAGVAAAVAAAACVSGLVMGSSLGRPALALLPVLGSELLGLAALVLGAGALGLSAWDAANVGAVAVDRTGCCRDDQALEAEARDTGLERGLALVTVLAGPASVAGGCVGAAVSSQVALALVGAGGFVAEGGEAAWASQQVASDPAWVPLALSLIPALCCAGPVALMPLLLGTPAGLLHLLWPARSWVADGALVAGGDVETPPVAGGTGASGEGPREVEAEADDDEEDGDGD
jgi:hypothetical protein